MQRKLGVFSGIKTGNLGLPILASGGAAIPSPLLTGLVDYWKLDESSNGSGQVVRVGSKGAHTATDPATCASGTGKISNGAVMVAASSEYLSITDHADLRGGDRDFMWCGWVKWNTVADAKSIISKWYTVGDKREYRFGYNYAANSKLSFYVSATGTSTIAGVHDTEIGTPSPDTWYFFCFWHDSVNNQIGIQINNGTAYVAGHTTGVVGTKDADIGFGADVTDNMAGYAGYADIVLDEVGRWNRILTAEERTTLYNGGSGNTYPFDSVALNGQVVFDGDSLTDGAFSTYPRDVYSSLTGKWIYHDVGVSGRQNNQLRDEAAAKVDPLLVSSLAKKIVVIWSGTNDLSTGGQAGDAAYAELLTYIQARKAAGWRVIVLTMIKRTTDATVETRRGVYNGLIIANSAGADAVVDVASDAAFTDVTNATYYQGDQIHPTAAGYAVVAGLVAPAIGTL